MLQIVFQDCGSALNPRMTVGETVAEPLKNFNLANGKKLNDRGHMVACHNVYGDFFLPKNRHGGMTPDRLPAGCSDNA